MPAFVKTPRDERLWKKAKKLAEEAGRAGDYAYINGIFQKMTKSEPTLVLDLNKSGVGPLRPGGVGEEKRWTRYPGAASMFNARDAEARETRRLMSEMPSAKLTISDGNFTSPDDVVKGLGFAPTDETLWAHRVARMVSRAPSELALRKAVAGDLRGETLEPTLRAELGRRILSLYRQSSGGKPLEKGFSVKKQPPKGGIGKQDDEEQPGAPPPPGMAPGGKPQAPGRAPTMPPPGAGGQDAGAASRNPAVDAAELTEMPDDKQLLQHKIHALHEELKATQGPITGNAALIHMHNDLKAQMRNAYNDPHPEVVADLDHKIRHFKKMLEGPPAPETDPNDPNAAPPGSQPGRPGPGGFGSRGQPAKPGAMAGQSPGRQPGKRPPLPMMGKSERMQGAPTPALGQAARGTPTEGRGFAMKPKGQTVTAGMKSNASPTLKQKKRGTKGMKGARRAPAC